MISNLILATLLSVLGPVAPYPQDTFSDCKICHCNLTYLTANCSFRNWSSIPRYLHRNIHFLNLEGNKLTNIPPGSFIPYRDLKQLNLERNRLNLSTDSYTVDAFVGLVNLTVLKIGGNCNYNLKRSSYSYPHHAFGVLTSLAALFIDGVPDAVFGTDFRKLRNLRNITFQGHCYLKYIQKDMFKYTPNLRVLNMSNCHIYDIHKEAFSPLVFIDTIDISQNYGLGMDNLSLATYGLQKSPIRVLYARHLVLPFSMNIRIKNNSFDYLYNTSIQELYLDHNRIEILEPGTLDKYPSSLRVLSVNDNRFTVGQYVYESMKMTGLERLYVSDMTITHHFLHSDPVQTLYGDVGQLQPPVWQGPPNLRHIVARNYLMNGKISVVNINLSSILSVDFSNNVLTRWEGRVSYVNSLQHVDLSRCFCSYIDQQFFNGMPNVVSLNISYNLIGDVLKNDSEGNIFSSLTSLQNLDLSTNRIKQLPSDMFVENTKLLHLNLSDNEISNISFKLEQLANLVCLDLHRNEIATLPHQTRAAMDDIPNLTVDLSENPLLCTCENIDFLIWLSKTKVRKTFRTYICVDINNEVKQLNETLINELEEKCRSFFGIITGGLAGTVLFLTVSVMGIVYRYRWKLKYLYYVARDRYRPPRRYGEEERYFEFDAFVSCADEDLEFVDQLINQLEGKGKRLCVHHRDFRPGEPIAANIVKAVQRSRRTLIVLSRHFLSSTWCRYEFEMAKMESVHEARDVILIVKIAEIGSADIARELMFMMETESYAEFPEGLEDQTAFWLTLNSAI